LIRLLAAWRVSIRVNTPKNDGPDLLPPLGEVVGPVGIEPTTPRLKVSCSTN
jgi:hypothetical protein